VCTPALTTVCPGLPADQCAQRRCLVLGHAEHRIARAVVRQTDHRRTGGQHHAGLGVDRSHHARRIGREHRVASQVGLHTGLRCGLLGLAAGGV